MRTLVISILGTLILISCKTNRKSSIIINNKRFEGTNISDTLYNGLVKEYDIKTNSLLSETEYLNNILNGRRKEYYSNAEVSSMSYYEMGKINGVVSIYDTNGVLIKKDRYYYDMRVGESIEYFNGNIADFSFYSFDRELLMTINYLNPINKMVTDFVDGFFFIKKDLFSDVNVNGISDMKREFFLYTPNPPKYNFRYSLVTTDSLYKRINIVKEFDANKPWSKFSIENFNKLGAGLNYKIMLKVYDSIAGGDITMYKMLKY